MRALMHGMLDCEPRGSVSGVWMLVWSVQRLSRGCRPWASRSRRRDTSFWSNTMATLSAPKWLPASLQRTRNTEARFRSAAMRYQVRARW